MLGASYSLELSERVLTEQRNPEETEGVTASGSSKEAFNSGVSRQLVRMDSRFKVSHGLVQKRIILTTWFQGKVG